MVYFEFKTLSFREVTEQKDVFFYLLLGPESDKFRCPKQELGISEFLSAVTFLSGFRALQKITLVILIIFRIQIWISRSILYHLVKLILFWMNQVENGTEAFVAFWGFSEGYSTAMKHNVRLSTMFLHPFPLIWALWFQEHCVESVNILVWLCNRKRIRCWLLSTSEQLSKLYIVSDIYFFYFWYFVWKYFVPYR